MTRHRGLVVVTEMQPSARMAGEVKQRRVFSHAARLSDSSGNLCSRGVPHRCTNGGELGGLDNPEDGVLPIPVETDVTPDSAQHSGLPTPASPSAGCPELEGPEPDSEVHVEDEPSEEATSLMIARIPASPHSDSATNTT